MDISQIDPNFKYSTIPEGADIVWHNLSNAAFSLHGVQYDKDLDLYLRMPKEIAEKTSEGVAFLNKNTSGGRIRFITDSPYIAVKIEGWPICPMRHMTLCGSHGVALFEDGVFRKSFAPLILIVTRACHAEAYSYAFEDHCGLKTQGEKLIELYLPLYGSIRNIEIGLQSGAKILPAPEYKITKPVIFYGNSVTQGGCACQAGASYPAFLSRWLDFDFVNLGFSGNGKAEPVMCEYLANLETTAFVLDYDHNAPNPEYLQKTHYPLYETIRKKQPNTPILFLTKADWYNNSEDSAKRREIIYSTYQKAKALGDKNVWFIDGRELFGKELTLGTVDSTHPNDLGFLRMAERIKPVLEEMLESIK